MARRLVLPILFPSLSIAILISTPMTPLLFASLPLDSADTLASQAIHAAQQAGVAICVAVVDHAGHTLVAKRMPGAPLHSLDIALDKAFTAISFGFPTGDWQARLAERPSLLRHGLNQRPRFIGFGGGLPVYHDGQRLGAIGVSGGSEAQDVAFAQAALNASGLA